jgi:hypothetical protein
MFVNKSFNLSRQKYPNIDFDAKFWDEMKKFVYEIKIITPIKSLHRFI